MIADLPAFLSAESIKELEKYPSLYSLSMKYVPQSKYASNVLPPVKCQPPCAAIIIVHTNVRMQIYVYMHRRIRILTQW